MIPFRAKLAGQMLLLTCILLATLGQSVHAAPSSLKRPYSLAKRDGIKINNQHHKYQDIGVGIPPRQQPPLPAVSLQSPQTRHGPVSPSPFYSNASLNFQYYNLSVPVDHFHNDSQYAPHSKDTFNLRYTFTSEYYKPGGPVLVFLGGEESISPSMLQYSIVMNMTQAVNGIAVLLEHRYYGTSMPVPDYSTPNLRFLTVEQTLADNAFFAQNVQFPGLQNVTLTAPTTKWILYSISYPGMLSAVSRIVYPDIFYGAIGSSAITNILPNFWQYFEPIRQNAPQTCVSLTESFVSIIDGILLPTTAARGGSTANSSQSSPEYQLKDLFNMAFLTWDDGFANILAYTMYTWQEIGWDANLTTAYFYQYCDTVSNTSVGDDYNDINRTRVEVLIEHAGLNAADSLVTAFINFIGWNRYQMLGTFAPDGYNLQAAIYQHNLTFLATDSLEIGTGSWRPWQYQTCRQMGGVMTGEYPYGIAPLVSRLITFDYSLLTCRAAFNLTAPPDVASINKYGGINIAYDRLAFIDGTADPVLYETPHSPLATVPPSQYNTSIGSTDVYGNYTLAQRNSTASEPFLTIIGGHHGWDQDIPYNLGMEEHIPQSVESVQAQEVQIVMQWLSIQENLVATS